RGRKPKHALTEEVRSEVLRLFEEKYSDSNFCHYSELLEEREGMRLSPSSVGRQPCEKLHNNAVQVVSGYFVQNDVDKVEQPLDAARIDILPVIL
ncbi:MAG: hypothetical protein LBQ56_05465, partial [Synergistaceae bacterium]|nr:hypothetical protein [Synergistaceae bacterium]